MTSFVLSAVPEIRFGAGRLADIVPLAAARGGSGATLLLVVVLLLVLKGRTKKFLYLTRRCV